MGLHTLKTILEKKGSNFLEKFLSEKLIITEKLDTYRILFEKQGDKIVFFKKDNTKLNLIERTLTNTWEDAIIELTTIIGDTMLPENLRFGIAYTPVERPIRIPYSNLPKYILTDVTLRKNNKISEVYNYDEVNKWAATLNVARPPIIFDGILSENQKFILKNYSEGNYEEIKEDNFSKIIEDLFEKTYSNEHIIEGIILKHNNNLAQIISYEFNLLNEAYNKEEYSRDYYDIMLLNINSFMDSYSMPILEGGTPDEMYLEIISDVFNKFCKKNVNIIENINPEYLTPPSFGYFGDLNLLLIKNKETLKILESKEKIYEALFRIMISSLRKPKKEFGLLNEAVIKNFNTYVYLIKDIIKDKSEPIIESINENTINELHSDNVVIKKMIQPNDVDNMRIIASIQKAFEPMQLEEKRGENNVVIYITDCQPITNSQIENIEAMSAMWKCPVIIGAILNERKTKGENFHLSDELIKGQLNAISIFYNNTITAYFLMDSWNLLELFEYCRPKYEPIAILTDKGKKSEFALQLYFEDEIMGGRIDVDKDFNIGEMENKNQNEAYRAIEDNVFYTFKQLTPQPIWGLFDLITNEYRVWSGQFLQNTFKETKFIE